MAKIGTAEIRKFLSSHLDRAVVLLFLFLLLGTIYVTVQKLNQDYKVLCKIEPANRPKDVSTAKPEDVTKAILSKPEESDYEELSKKNIFQNAEERLARQRQIKAKYDQCSTLIDAGHYADSIRMLEQILQEDQDEVLMEYTIKPSILIRNVKKEMEKSELLSIYQQAEDKFHEAEDEETKEDGSLLTAKSTYESSLQDYERMLGLDVEAGLLSEEIKETATNQVQEVKDRIERLTQVTFRQEIQSDFEQATGFVETADEAPSKLAEARRLLNKALARVNEVDPAHQIVNDEMVGQIQSTLETVQLQVSQRLPSLFSDGQRVFEEGQSEQDLGKLNLAKEKLEAVAELDSEYQNVEQLLRELQGVIEELSAEQVTELVLKNLEIARRSLQEVDRTIQEEDYESYEKAKKEGLEACSYIRTLGREGFEDYKKEAKQLEMQLRPKQFPPPVRGWELVNILERPYGGKTDYQAVLHELGSPPSKTVRLVEGQEDSQTGLTVVEIDKENKGFVWVRKTGCRKTQLMMKQ